MANEFQIVIHNLQKEEQYDLVTVAQNRAFKMALTQTITMYNQQLTDLEYQGDDKKFVLDHQRIKQRKLFAQEMLETLIQLHKDIQREIQDAQT